MIKDTVVELAILLAFGRNSWAGSRMGLRSNCGLDGNVDTRGVPPGEFGAGCSALREVHLHEVSTTMGVRADSRRRGRRLLTLLSRRPVEVGRNPNTQARRRPPMT